MSTPNVLWTADGPATLFGVRLRVNAAVAVHAADYWTVSVSIRRAGQTEGEPVGSWSGQTRLLPARERFVLYNDAVGTPLLDGDEIVATATKTGSPAALVDPVSFLDVQRRRK